ncbi:exonuclease 1 isoform X1 [Panicum miliaceum]|uniref:Exonuclease 1 n=1 Tax=Panicum miliaceum TaxID=4540 RepID=A0A3L6SWT9_PANMI|nr:exonuclease 1 isoform X1 [Panicum miliaceum]
MGIPNLLRFLKPFIEPVHINKYAGKRVGIDAYSWLHKGAYSCSMELCMDPKSAAARRYISYFMHHINLLRHYKVVPVVVFDGGSMPCKAATDNERQRKRELSLNMAKEKLEQGNTTAAVDLFRKAVHITPSMAYQLIQILRSANVEFVVAPYEADAQLAYLTTLNADQGGIAAVVTEDSDLIAYCCPAIIFKMDRFGNGEEFTMERTLKTEKHGLSFREFDQQLFTGMCVLAGCDFLPSISGIGTKRAYSIISKYKDINRVISNLKLDKRYSVPDDYADSLWKTLAVFNHARVALSPSIARGIAEGHLNPITMKAFDQYSRIISPIGFLDTSAFDIANECGSQEISTQKSCITILSSQESKENMLVDEISSDGQKCKKGVLALGKFLLQKQSPRVESNQVELKNIPENNPFKKRKLPADKGQGLGQNELLIDREDEKSDLSCSALSQESNHAIKDTKQLGFGQEDYDEPSLLVNEVPVAICSSLTRHSVKSMPNKMAPKRQKILKRSMDKTNKKANGSSGILKFFTRL